jgi:hypothetical protein
MCVLSNWELRQKSLTVGVILKMSSLGRILDHDNENL